MKNMVIIFVLFRYPVMKTEFTFFYAFWELAGGWSLEWAAKKGFGRVRVAIKPDLTADVIVTHTAAEHQSRADVNIETRTIQAKKIISYVKKLEAATNPSDLIILGGDLNSQPNDPAYSVIASIFTDTGKEKREATYGHPENTYTSGSGQSTLDYIFVRHQGHVSLKANQSVVDFK